MMAERINTPMTNEHFAAFCLSMIGQPYWYGCVIPCLVIKSPRC